MRIAAGFALNQELNRFVLSRGYHGIKWGEKICLDLNYTDDLSILDESVSKMNEHLEVL